MTRYLGFAMVMLAVSSLFLAGCGSPDKDMSGDDKSNGQTNSTAIERGAAQGNAATPNDTGPGDMSFDSAREVDTGFGPGDAGQNASAPREKKSVLGALGNALYKGAAGAAKEDEDH